MESTGARLKKIRLEKGISLEEVQKKTRIHLDILKAIEEDSLINISPVYTKGFLKIYCRFLGEDPKDFIPNYKEPQRVTAYADSAVKKSEQTSFLKIASDKLASLKIKQIKKVITFFLAGILLIGLFNLGKAISLGVRNRTANKEKQTKAQTVKPVSKENPTQKVNAAAEKITPPAQTEPAPKAESESGIRLGIIARENCYIPYLKTDGKNVFQGVLKKGRSEVWQAKNKIEFSLGNAGVVDLEVNGRQILPLGRKGQAVKNIVIDKEGLKTK
ncbi:MAG: DUF4115 domain-containing protein [Candidatus Omnitrophica bacterium]|nr:DUF4115 domain-containing protein [Candidatus Omnitrophota bacterium]